MTNEHITPEILERILLRVKTEIDKHVLVVDGKGLSTEDFTTALKNKLVGIDLSKYSTTAQIKALITAEIQEQIGDVDAALDELHAYAEALKGGEAK